MKKIILMLLAVTALTGCSKFEQVPDANDENGSPVELYGDINTGAATRGAGVITGVPTGGLLFDLYRANQSGDPATYSAYTLKVNGTLGADPDHLTTITTDPKLYFLGEKSSSFIGLYPKDGTLDGNTVTYLVDGGTDILATQSLEASEGNQPGAGTPLEFQHLLTKIQVDIKVGANGATVDDRKAIISALGKVTAIKVEKKKVNAVVTLPNLSTEADGFYPTILAAASPEPTDLSLWKDNGKALDDTDDDGTSDPDGGIALTDDGNVVTIGYAMFLPVTEVLKLKITTAESDEDEYEVNIGTGDDPKYGTPINFAKGKGYRITLQVTENGLGLTEFSLVNVVGGILGWDDTPPNTDIVY